ncbi:MAG: hypothetical protein AB8B97_23740 [Granulosicoccus sp.]
MSKDTHNDPDGSANGFSESWLALREPADHLARDTALGDSLSFWFKQQAAQNIVEMGAGTGSNLRYLMPKLGQDQRWLLLDNDAVLFDRLPEILRSWAGTHNVHFSCVDDLIRLEHADFSATVVRKVVNLASQLDEVSLDNVQLITASALLDLTSAQWLSTLAKKIYSSECACLFALNYDGKIRWRPEIDADGTISKLLNEHQLNDKGFGTAKGPDAGKYFAQALTQLGRRVAIGQSDWVIQPQSDQLQLAIIDGWAPAAREQADKADDLISAWHTERKLSINQQNSTLVVGHIDILSLP